MTDVSCEVTVRADPDGHETWVDVAGNLDATSANACLKQLVHAMHATCPCLVVDLSGTSVVDQAGVGILTAARAQAVALGGHLRLVGIPGYLWPMIAHERLIGREDSGPAASSPG